MPVRDLVLPYLISPRCPREVREHTGLSRKTVESSLARASRAGLAVCVTPELRQARLYQLTPIGRQWVHQSGLSPATPLALPAEMTPPVLHLYSWVQAGHYRRLVVRHLEGLLTVRDLRRRILREHQRIGSNHVRATLRALAMRQAVERQGFQLWQLTELGRRVQAALLVKHFPYQ